MRIANCFVLGCVLMAPAVLAEEALDGRAVLLKAQAAMKSAKVISYNGELAITGYYARELPEVRGKVVIGKQSELKLDRFVCDVKLKMPGSQDWLEYPIGSNGDKYFRLDHAQKLLREDIDPLIMGTRARHAQRVLLRDFAAAEPMKNDLAAASITLRESESVAGEDCYVVFAATWPAQPYDTQWHISKKDFFPRRLQRIFKREAEGATTSITLNGLKVDPPSERDPFEAVLPAGYTKTDQFPE